MSLHKEIEFENDICAHLAAHDWLYQPALAGVDGDFANYDCARAMFPADVIAWVQTTQPKAWDALSKSYGAAAIGYAAKWMIEARWMYCGMALSC